MPPWPLARVQEHHALAAVRHDPQALREALIHDDERPGDDDATQWVS